MNYLLIFIFCFSCLLIGCKTTDDQNLNSGDLTSTEEQKAVTCSKCETTWVYEPQGQGKTTTFSRKETMSCPDCQSAAANFFKTGEFKHTCTNCGDAVEHCTTHHSKLESTKKSLTAQSNASCSKCKTLWLYQPQNQGKVITFSTKKTMSCEGCQSDAMNFFGTGELKKTCTHCESGIDCCKEIN